MPDPDKRIAEALEIIAAAGIPVERESKRRNKRKALALLAIADLTPKKPWSKAAIFKTPSSYNVGTRQIIKFWNQHYGETLSLGSYDDVRRKDLIYLVKAGIALKSAGQPRANTNNHTRGYAVAPSAADLLHTYGTPRWTVAVKNFLSKAGILREKLERTRQQSLVSVTLPNGKSLNLSYGPHNDLQKAIIMDFLPRFIPGAEVLYVGDTTNKALIRKDDHLRRLGFNDLSHDTLPDIVAYDQKRNWIILVEAVHSANPISQLRHLILEELTEACSDPRIYVSAFENRKLFKKMLLEISWETEVWLADTPDHLIHFDGDRFLGPY